MIIELGVELYSGCSERDATRQNSFDWTTVSSFPRAWEAPRIAVAACTSNLLFSLSMARIAHCLFLVGFVFLTAVESQLLIEPVVTTEPRYDAAATFSPDDRSIYVFGGITASGGPSNDLIKFDITTKEWTSVFRGCFNRVLGHPCAAGNARANRVVPGCFGLIAIQWLHQSQIVGANQQVKCIRVPGHHPNHSAKPKRSSLWSVPEWK